MFRSVRLNLMHLHSSINWPEAKWSQRNLEEIIKVFVLDAKGVHLNAVVMQSPTLSPTWWTSGTESWPASRAGNHLGALSHRIDGWIRCRRSSRKTEDRTQTMNELKLLKLMLRDDQSIVVRISHLNIMHQKSWATFKTHYICTNIVHVQNINYLSPNVSAGVWTRWKVSSRRVTHHLANPFSVQLNIFQTSHATTAAAWMFHYVTILGKRLH